MEKRNAIEVGIEPLFILINQIVTCLSCKRMLIMIKMAYFIGLIMYELLFHILLGRNW